MTRQWKLVLAGAFVFGLMAGFVFFLAKPDTPQKVTVVQSASYIEVTREDMIASADAIFLGRVVAISPTRWNQDSGEEWNDDAIGGDSGIQIHTIEVEILQPVVDTIGLGKQVTITALGVSPVDGIADHNLKDGVRAVFFIVQTELAWRGKTTRPIFEFIGAPTESYYLLGSDGLYYDGRPDAQALSFEDIVKIVAQRRTDLIQP
jgi:hypothetical protein